MKNEDKYFLNDWKNKTKQDILDEFCEKQDHNIVFASYVYDNYEGEAFVLVEKDGKLYEVNADHCSCFGLEGQFNLEETSIQAIEHRLKNSTLFGNWYWGTKNIFRNELIDFIENYKELENEK